MLIVGVALMAASLLVLLGVLGYWSQHNFSAIRNALPAATAAALLVIGAQNALGGFLLAIVNGNEAELLRTTAQEATKYAARDSAPASCEKSA